MPRASQKQVNSILRVFSPPTALALPLKMGDFGMSRWQLPCETTPILREVGSAAMSLRGTKVPIQNVRYSVAIGGKNGHSPGRWRLPLRRHSHFTGVSRGICKTCVQMKGRPREATNLPQVPQIIPIARSDTFPLLDAALPSIRGQPDAGRGLGPGSNLP